MARTLHFDLAPDHLHPAFGSLLSQARAGQKKHGYQLSAANALWGQRGEDPRPDFVKTAREHYRGGLNSVDFVNDAEGARRQINNWVAKGTRNRIRELLAPGDVTDQSRLVLVNAIYFKGSWAHRFPKRATGEEPFRVTADRSVKVAMMSQTEKFAYHKADDFQALELPYVGETMSMLILLPDTVDGLPQLEKRMSADWLKGLLLWDKKVEVSLPRFKVAGRSDLGKTLSAMGMPLAFDRQRADFRGATDHVPGWFIAKVIHEALVEVNEEGTEAAAATAVVKGTKSAAPEPPARFNADHPFVFLIRDNRSGSILFMGRLVNPPD
jgi:serpin B